ncbi:DUF1700 domain-containing protein [Chitinophaga pendula]|uniref:HAAS signaling domain-containing protein n=1 Tax=Chitinophaga TaxID=79328 RepID=UPI000BB0029C|nr:MULTISPECIES: hypothetical protein [Chitinophaga]ASZ12979.1 hypothetical protein CK934_19450 [Chitinophaga sp. MD30]UCJ09389.1 DUF1700 domain-containing protein [Chitinophaga pendula]
MQKIPFRDAAAQKAYEDYLSDVENAISHLPKQDRQEIIMELNSHLYEALQETPGNTEHEKLISIITQLGEPYISLRPVIAEKTLNRAIKTFNPRLLLSALYVKALNSIKYTCFFILYLLLISIASLLFFKALYPRNTGLFYKEGKISGFGFLLDVSDTTEVLHGWFYPVVIALVILLYVILTLALRISRKKK